MLLYLSRNGTVKCGQLYGCVDYRHFINYLINSPQGKVHLIRGKLVHFPGEKRRNGGKINIFGRKVHQKSGKMVHFPQKGSWLTPRKQYPASNTPQPHAATTRRNHTSHALLKTIQKTRPAKNVTGLVCSAQDQTRTDTPLLALPPQSSASTNFATCAFDWDCKCRNFFLILKISCKKM